MPPIVVLFQSGNDLPLEEGGRPQDLSFEFLPLNHSVSINSTAVIFSVDNGTAGKDNGVAHAQFCFCG